MIFPGHDNLHFWTYCWRRQCFSWASWAFKVLLYLLYLVYFDGQGHSALDLCRKIAKPSAPPFLGDGYELVWILLPRLIKHPGALNRSFSSPLGLSKLPRRRLHVTMVRLRLLISHFLEIFFGFGHCSHSPMGPFTQVPYWLCQYQPVQGAWDFGGGSRQVKECSCVKHQQQ